MLALALTFVAAGNSRAAHLRVSSAAAPPGGLAVVQVHLADTGDRPAALVVALDFDTAPITVFDVVPGAASGDATMEYRFREDGLTLVFFGGGEPLADGLLATVYMDVAADAAPGTVVGLRGDGSSAADGDAEPLRLTMNAPAISVAPLDAPHDADTDGNGRLGLSEVMRLVQFFHAGALYCAEGTEDGFSPAGGHRDCAPHDADYAPQDWQISLSELLRCIQFYNGLRGAYHRDSSGEDGFAPGPVIAVVE